MASSDDESEEVMEVSNYHFEDEKEGAVSFSCLPIQWNGDISDETKKKQVFLRGDVDGGLRKFWSQVTAWKFDLLNAAPEISVLLKDRNWVKLRKPRKSYENESIRSILVTVHCLHFVSKNPEASAKSMWDHVLRLFRSHEVRPSHADLVSHIDLIREAVKRDDSLAKSKFLCAFLEAPGGAADKDLQPAVRQEFIVDDMDEDTVNDADDDDESNEEEFLFDSVCAFCDNGGELLCCEGSCMRSFHATSAAGIESECDSLGLSSVEVKAMQNFFCKNCQYKQHQCFACGKLGSSDKSSSAEVFRCISATCGHFYHARCVATLLHPGDTALALELRKQIDAGESFACPIHMCCVCKEGEDKDITELQFAICRRCPTSYHRKCLPREIPFEDDSEDEDIITRAWDNLLPSRVLIYCLKHKIDEEIGTPVRDHIKFPGVEEKRTSFGTNKKHASGLRASQATVLPKKKSIYSEGSLRDAARKLPKQLPPAMGKSISFKSSEKTPHGPDSLKKVKAESSQKSVARKKTMSARASIDGNKLSLGNRLFAAMQGSEQRDGQDDSTINERDVEKPVTQRYYHQQLPPLDADRERRLLDIMREVDSSITLEDVIRKHKKPSTHRQSLKSVLDKNITMGKVEGSVKAVRVASKMLDNGCSIAEAKAVCEPAILIQVSKWKDKLQVYLAPFLYGSRYTSFGRHFTKLDKLEAIVEKLHWYVEDGDVIVDFCCGSNDFSCLMKSKLDAFGKKKCIYKNFDMFPAKNTFNFELRNWMTVETNELPIGSRLVMGLNPPFGVQGKLANQFIDKALEFNPKLLILIVPPETERLDKKINKSYDLIWEDGQLLAGKAFYLPGSIDGNCKQLDQWNITAPPLYLWSRSDRTADHRAIAENQGHLSIKASPCIDKYSEQDDGDNTSYVDTSVMALDIPMDIDGDEKEQVEAANGESQIRRITVGERSKSPMSRQSSGRSAGSSPSKSLDRPSSSSELRENRYHYPEPPVITYGTSRTDYTMSRDEPYSSTANHEYESYMHGLERESLINPVYRDPNINDVGYHQMGSQNPNLLYRDPRVDPYRMDRSVTQRYAPRLDEMNQPRIIPNVASQPPITMSRSGIYDTGSLQGQFHSDHLTRGFPSSHYPYPRPGFGGWQ